MANKVITINGTFSPRKVNESLTEEEFADMFFDFLDKNDLIFGGGWTEEDDEEQQEGAAKRRPTVAERSEAIYEASRRKELVNGLY